MSVSLLAIITARVQTTRRQRCAAAISGLADIVAPPPPPRGLIDFARGLIIPENGPNAPGYDPDSHAAQREILRAIASGQYKELVIIGPAQDGKTLVTAIIIVWVLVELRRSVVLGAPDMNLNNELWRDKILPLIAANGYEHLLPDSGPGSESATAPSLLLRNGARMYRLGAGAKNQAGQAMRTCYLVVIEERDDIRDEKAAKLKQRNKSGGDDDYLTIELSTIKDSRSSSILRGYGRSTQTSIAIGCPHCGSVFTPNWHQHRRMDESSSSSAAATVVIVCPECQTPISPEDLADQASPRRGAHGVHGADSHRFGIRWSCLTSHRSRTRRLATEWVDAQAEKEMGNTKALETIYQDDLAEAYEDTARTLKTIPRVLAAKSAAALYPLGSLPAVEQAPIITMSIDVQHRRLYFSAMAHSADGATWWIVDHGMHPLCLDGEQPTEEQVKGGLNWVYNRVMDGYTRPNGLVDRPIIGGVDVKDGTNPHREAILDWIAVHPGIYPLHGVNEKQAKDTQGGATILRIPGVLSVNRQTTTVPHYDLIAINVNVLKGRVLRDLIRTGATPAQGYLPHGEAATGWLIKELCAEELEETPDGMLWVKRYQHNHRLDTTVHNLALAAWKILQRNHARTAASHFVEGATA